jgi:hypothetical protein
MYRPLNPLPRRRPRSTSGDGVKTTATIQIDDLAEPQFSDEAKAILTAMTERASRYSLEPAALIDTAKAQTGLSDFGDPSFQEPLEVLCRALRTEAELNPLGVCLQAEIVVRYLANRLLVEDLLKRHPVIRDVSLAPPIIIAGMTRTGTSHLHNLLAADPGSRSLPHWEGLEPVLPADQQPAPTLPDPRIARAEQYLTMLNVLMPHFRRMHEMSSNYRDEDIALLGLDLSCLLLELNAHVPSYRDWYKATDQTRSYRYLRTIVQALTWQRGPNRWVLKSPQHLEQLRPLKAAFPDATVVFTHRDPARIVASLATMVAYSRRTHRDKVDLMQVGRYIADRVKDFLTAALEDRDVWPQSQSIDVSFQEFMADEIGTVERIYARAGVPLTDQAQESMRVYREQHQRERHGLIAYDLSVFGLDADEIRDSVRPYIERFGVVEE